MASEARQFGPQNRAAIVAALRRAVWLKAQRHAALDGYDGLDALPPALAAEYVRAAWTELGIDPAVLALIEEGDADGE